MHKNRQKLANILGIVSLFCCILLGSLTMPQDAYSLPFGGRLSGNRTANKGSRQSSSQSKPADSNQKKPSRSQRPSFQKDQDTGRRSARIFRRRKQGGSGNVTRPSWDTSRKTGWHEFQPYTPLSTVYAADAADEKTRRGHQVASIIGTTSGRERVEIVSSIVGRGESAERRYSLSGAGGLSDSTPVNIRLTFDDGHKIGDIATDVGFLREYSRTRLSIQSPQFPQEAAQAIMQNDPARTPIHIAGSDSFEQQIAQMLRSSHELLPQYRNNFRDGIKAIYEIKETEMYIDNNTGVVFVGSQFLDPDFEGLPRNMFKTWTMSQFSHEATHGRMVPQRYSFERQESGALGNRQQRQDELIAFTHQVFYLQDLAKVTGQNYNKLTNMLKGQSGGHFADFQQRTQSSVAQGERWLPTVIKPDVFLQQRHPELVPELLLKMYARTVRD